SANEPKALAAAARRGFQHYWIADGLRDFSSFVVGLDGVERSRNHRNTEFRHNATRFDFRAHQENGFGRRSDERHTAFGTSFGESRVFGEESVSGMNCVRL